MLQLLKQSKNPVAPAPEKKAEEVKQQAAPVYAATTAPATSKSPFTSKSPETNTANNRLTNNSGAMGGDDMIQEDIV